MFVADENAVERRGSSGEESVEIDGFGGVTSRGDAVVETEELSSRVDRLEGDAVGVPLACHELAARIREMREQLAAYQSEFGVESPEALAVDQTNRALAPDSTPAAPDSETIREWKTLRRNLAFANAALSIGNAEQFVDGDRRPTDDSLHVGGLHDYPVGHGAAGAVSSSPTPISSAAALSQIQKYKLRITDTAHVTESENQPADSRFSRE